MFSRNSLKRVSRLALLTVLLCASFFGGRAQSNNVPLTSQELVRLVYQLPKQPEKRDEVVDEIRRRGIGFPLTDGMRSLVATKSGNDATLRRTLEEAERRRVNPTASALPSTVEAEQLLNNARAATLAASEAMPDFIVRQLITRSEARGKYINWRVLDHLSIAVSYRASRGEEYKLLSVNGQPPVTDAREGGSYEEVGGTSSTGEYVSMLAALFKETTQATFRVVDTDTLRSHRTVVYEFNVRKENSNLSIKAGRDRSVITGYRGRVWLDRESFRVLRVEMISTEIPADFPVTAASSMIDYDWVVINERRYLLPVAAEIKLTAGSGEQARHSRNEIRFRGYQKFGAEVKIIEDVEPDEEPQTKPQTNP
ncbi:MAG TPA: hypothetical protein VF528_21410 [Pyrinomonadaceae bacterium]|jgi:hypothetical protein